MSKQFTIPTTGDVVAGKYRLMEELGRGSYGVVFRAVQLGDVEREVAFKTLLPQGFMDDEVVERFRREIQVISLLKHPNIVTLYDYGHAGGLLYMVMEYVHGRSLDVLIDKQAPLPPARVRELALQILGALQYAHAEGIIHRDLKPDNILLLPPNPADPTSKELAKIVDFGIAKVVQGDQEQSALKTLTQAGFCLGTPQYMSPENITGDPVDHRADLYAVGLMIYQMLTGVHPFDAPNPSAVMVRHLRDDAPPLPDDLEASFWGPALRRTLEKQPDDRISSATELIEMLSAKGPAPTTRVGGARPRPKPAPASADPEDVSQPSPNQTSPFSTRLVVAVVVALLAVIGLAIWTARQHHPHAHHAGTPSIVAPHPAKPRPPKQPPRKPTAVTHHAAKAHPSPAPVARPPSRATTGNHSVGKHGSLHPSTVHDRHETRGHTARARPDRGRHRPHAQPARRHPEHTAHTPTKQPAVVHLHVTSSPANARVSVAGEPLGTTPLDYAVARGDKPVLLEFSLLGYQDKYVRVVPNRDRKVSATLKQGRIKLIP